MPRSFLVKKKDKDKQKKHGKCQNQPEQERNSKSGTSALPWTQAGEVQPPSADTNELTSHERTNGATVSDVNTKQVHDITIDKTVNNNIHVKNSNTSEISDNYEAMCHISITEKYLSQQDRCLSSSQDRQNDKERQDGLADRHTEGKYRHYKNNNDLTSQRQQDDLKLEGNSTSQPHNIDRLTQRDSETDFKPKNSHEDVHTSDFRNYQPPITDRGITHEVSSGSELLNRRLSSESEHLYRRISSQSQHFSHRLSTENEHFSRRISSESENSNRRLSSENEHFGCGISSESEHLNRRFMSENDHLDPHKEDTRQWNNCMEHSGDVIHIDIDRDTNGHHEGAGQDRCPSLEGGRWSDEDRPASVSKSVSPSVSPATSVSSPVSRETALSGASGAPGASPPAKQHHQEQYWPPMPQQSPGVASPPEQRCRDPFLPSPPSPIHIDQLMLPGNHFHDTHLHTKQQLTDTQLLNSHQQQNDPHPMDTPLSARIHDKIHSRIQDSIHDTPMSRIHNSPRIQDSHYSDSHLKDPTFTSHLTSPLRGIVFPYPTPLKQYRELNSLNITHSNGHGNGLSNANINTNLASFSPKPPYNMRHPAFWPQMGYKNPHLFLDLSFRRLQQLHYNASDTNYKFSNAMYPQVNMNGINGVSNMNGINDHYKLDKREYKISQECDGNESEMHESNGVKEMRDSASGNSPSGISTSGISAPQRFNCDGCQKSYSTFSGLSKHKQFHCTTHVKKQFCCKYCDKTYVSLGALKMHIRTHTLPCKCPLCGKSFSRPWLLQGHLRTHTGEKPFSCSHCSRAFADRSNLRAHLQTHSEVKKYSCKNCSKTFSRMSLLLKHEDGGCTEKQ